MRGQCEEEIIKRHHPKAVLVDATYLAKVCHVQPHLGYAETHNEIGPRFFTDIN